MKKAMLVLAAALSLGGVAAAGPKPFPALISLPAGIRPEGIEVGNGTTFYVGSLATGAIYRGDLRSGSVSSTPLVSGAAGRAALGIELAHGKLFVAGGPTGRAFVYDARTGAELANLQLTTVASFVNDVVVTRTAAWFTDSTNKVLYRVALGAGGAVGAVTTVPLTGQIVWGTGFNANGIDATANGKTLVIVQTNTGKLYTVTPAGVTTEIDLGGGSVPNGDGILLAGRTLYVVRNVANTIAKIRLDARLRSGRIVRLIADSDFDVPTTVDDFGSRLYAVNARFTTTPTPTTPYQVVQTRK